MSTRLTADLAAGLLRQASTRAKFELPPGLVAELAAIDRTVRPERPWVDHDAAALRAAVVDCIFNGRDPADDPTVQRELPRAQLRHFELAAWVNEEAQARRARALAQHFDALLASMAAVVVAADEALAAAHAAVPGLDLVSETFAIGLRPEAVRRWGAAREAVDHVEQVVGAWKAAAVAAGLVRPVTHEALVVADLDLDQLEALGRTPGAAAAARAGHRLALVDAATYETRARKVAEERAHRADESRRQHDDFARSGYDATTGRLAGLA